MGIQLDVIVHSRMNEKILVVPDDFSTFVCFIYWNVKDCFLLKIHFLLPLPECKILIVFSHASPLDSTKFMRRPIEWFL